MDVTPVAISLFAFLGLVGTMLHVALVEQRPWLENLRTMVRANPAIARTAVKWALQFSQRYLDFVFGPGTAWLRAFGICVAISLFTTLIVLGAMFRSVNQGMSLRFVGFAILLGLVDMLGLVVTRKIINTAIKHDWHAGRTVGLTLFLIAGVAYFAMGLAWCVYYSVVAIGAGTTPDVGLLVMTFFIWLPSLFWVKSAAIIPAAAPGAMDTLFLLCVIALPALFMSTARISRPLFLRVLDTMLALPPQSGKVLGYVSAALMFLATLTLKR